MRFGDSDPVRRLLVRMVIALGAISAVALPFAAMPFGVHPPSLAWISSIHQFIPLGLGGVLLGHIMVSCRGIRPAHAWQRARRLWQWKAFEKRNRGLLLSKLAGSRSLVKRGNEVWQVLPNWLQLDRGHSRPAQTYLHLHSGLLIVSNAYPDLEYYPTRSEITYIIIPQTAATFSVQTTKRALLVTNGRGDVYRLDPRPIDALAIQLALFPEMLTLSLARIPRISDGG